MAEKDIQKQQQNSNARQKPKQNLSMKTSSAPKVLESKNLSVSGPRVLKYRRCKHNATFLPRLKTS